MKRVLICHTNHRGETAMRTIKPLHFWFGTDSYHKVEGHLLDAYDYEKQKNRTFAMRDIHFWKEVDG